MTDAPAEKIDGAKAKLKMVADEKKVPPTEYVVLEQRMMANEEGPEIAVWHLLGVSKGTKKAAISDISGGRSGTFKAVAASSWRGGETRQQVTKMESLPLDDT